MQNVISTAKVERMMQIAKDTKKEFSYSKGEGKWFWFDRGEENSMEWHAFPTFLEALIDAVEPYTD